MNVKIIEKKIACNFYDTLWYGRIKITSSKTIPDNAKFTIAEFYINVITMIEMIK